MNIIIAGAGEVGYNLIAALYRDYPKITVIDFNGETLERIRNEFGVKTLEVNLVDCPLFNHRGMEEVDLFLAITSDDETNMISCKMAKEAGAKKTFCRIRQIDLQGSKRKQTQETLGIDVVINPVRLAALELTQLTLTPNLIEKQDFFGGDMLLVGYRVQPYCQIIGKSGKEVRKWLLERNGELALIMRNERSIVATSEMIVEEGDRLYFFIHSYLHSDLRAYLGYRQYQKDRNRIFINGGGNIGLWLAKALEEEGYEVKIIEINADRCQYLSEHLEKTMVLNFDGTDKNQLLAEGLEEAHHFYSLTNNEEVNIASCLLAQSLRVPRTLALVKQVEMTSIIEHATPIHAALNPRQVTGKYLSRFVKGITLSSFCNVGHIEIQEMKMDADAPCVGKDLAALGCSVDLRIAMIKRGQKFILPQADTVLGAGDQIILLFHQLDRKKARTLFHAKEVV